MIGQNTSRIFKFGRHEFVVRTYVVFKILTVRERIGIDETAEHDIRLGIARFRLNTGFAFARARLRVVDFDIRILCPERAHNRVVLQIAHCRVYVQYAGSFTSLCSTILLFAGIQ